MGDSKRISPTAHYTGQVWQLAGLSTPALATREGKLFHAAFRPLDAASAALGGPTLTHMLVARHKAIDHLLAEAVDSGTVTQVLEIAAGYSPRGWRFTKKYGARLRYVEADLPHMAERKRCFLARVPPSERPAVVAVDALAASGPQSLHAVTANFDRTAGLAVVTEGLTSYLEPAAAREMWARLGALLGEFSTGIYLSDTRLASQARTSLSARVFVHLLRRFVRGTVHMQFEDEADARRVFAERGFARFTLHRPTRMTELRLPASAGAHFVQIVDARIR